MGPTLFCTLALDGLHHMTRITHCVSLEPTCVELATTPQVSSMPLGALFSLLGNKYRVKQVGQPTSAAVQAKRKESDLSRTQISMSWSFPTITSFTRLATKEKEKVASELAV